MSSNVHPLENRYVSVRRAAERIGIHPNTLRRYIAANRIPAIVLPHQPESKFGRRYRISLSDLRRFESSLQRS